MDNEVLLAFSFIIRPNHIFSIMHIEIQIFARNILEDDNSYGLRSDSDRNGNKYAKKRQYEYEVRDTVGCYENLDTNRNRGLISNGKLTYNN